ncbi:alpha/beta hydrolase [Actinomycetes bacterium M1A6_2h]
MNSKSDAAPVLHGSTRGRVTAAVLVLHGGKVKSHAPATLWQLSSVRMWPFTWALRRALDETAVVQLQYRFRGWNGSEESPVQDARWALAQIRERYGDIPVTLVGHSMGGRTAAAVADAPSVVAVAALAPWWPTGNETKRMRAGQSLLVVHGSADRWTDPALSRDATESASTRGVGARYVSIDRAGHFMLRAPWKWSNLVRDFVVDQSPSTCATKTR